MTARAVRQLFFLGALAALSAIYLAWRTYQSPAAPRVEVPPTATAPAPVTVAPDRTPAQTAARVLDPDLGGDARRAALFELTQAGPAALPALREVLLTPVPEDTVTEPFEVSLRITALEAIDDLAERGVDVGDAFAQAAQVHEDRALKTLAMAGLSGVQEGRPGKAKRFIKKMTDERD